MAIAKAKESAGMKDRKVHGGAGDSSVVIQIAAVRTKVWACEGFHTLRRNRDATQHWLHLHLEVLQCWSGISQYGDASGIIQLIFAVEPIVVFCSKVIRRQNAELLNAAALTRGLAVGFDLDQV